MYGVISCCVVVNDVISCCVVVNDVISCCVAVNDVISCCVVVNDVIKPSPGDGGYVAFFMRYVMIAYILR